MSIHYGVWDWEWEGWEWPWGIIWEREYLYLYSVIITLLDIIKIVNSYVYNNLSVHYAI